MYLPEPVSSLGVARRNPHGTVFLVEGPGYSVGRYLGKTLVRVDADVEGGAEVVGLLDEVSRTRLDGVDEHESDGLKGRVSTVLVSFQAKTEVADSLTSTTFSSCLRTAATGSPMKGTVVKRPALPIRMFRRTWWTRTNWIFLLVLFITRGDCTHLTECVEDGVGIRASLDRLRAIHLSDGSSDSGDDVGKTSNDLGEWSLADNDERSVDDGDGLSRGLESLALGGEHLDVADGLGGSDSRRDGSSESQSGSEDVADGDHFCGCKRSFCC